MQEVHIWGVPKQVAHPLHGRQEPPEATNPGEQKVVQTLLFKTCPAGQLVQIFGDPEHL